MLDDFRWAFRKLSELCEGLGITQPTIVTDREIALINAISQTFPHSKALLCRWYIDKNILAQQRYAFATFEANNKFTALWNFTISALTENDNER